MFTTFVADHDSELVARYRRSGLVIFGKTNTPEFGIVPTTEPQLFGPTKNPWDRAYTPGGSRAARPLRSPAAWCRPRTGTTAADRSAFPRLAVGSSG
jgi:hypothetical protein